MRSGSFSYQFYWRRAVAGVFAFVNFWARNYTALHFCFECDLGLLMGPRGQFVPRGSNKVIQRGTRLPRQPARHHRSLAIPTSVGIAGRVQPESTDGATARRSDRSPATGQQKEPALGGGNGRARRASPAWRVPNPRPESGLLGNDCGPSERPAARSRNCR